jgi:TolB-like protein
VNVAARLEGLADPGGICVSRTVFSHVKGKVDLGFEDLGEQEVKNIPEPVRVYRWTDAAADPMPGTEGALPLPDKASIAVLPFDNMSGDPAQDTFADGMTDDLITDLSKISDLFVVARNSSFVYKGKPVEIRKVAEDLGVRYVLEGSVRRSDDQVRVNAQLIDATTGGHLWAERYDGNVTDIFAVQDAFIRKIVGALAVNLSAEEQEEIARGQSANIEAREAFQKGWEHYFRFSSADNAKAAEQFKIAVELDPEYGRAYSALGMVYVRGCQWLWNEDLGMSAGEANSTAQSYLSEGKKRSAFSICL